MAEIAGSRKITDLTEKTTLSDTDLLVEGTSGTDSMRKFSLSTLATWVQSKVSAFTFAFRNGTDTIKNAVDALMFASGSQAFTYWGYGTITTSNKDIVFEMPTNRVLSNRSVSSVLLTALSIRQDGDYLVSEAYNAEGISGYTCTASINACGVRIILHKVDGQGNQISFGGTNNSILSVYIRYTITFA